MLREGLHEPVQEGARTRRTVVLALRDQPAERFAHLGQLCKPAVDVDDLTDRALANTVARLARGDAATEQALHFCQREPERRGASDEGERHRRSGGCLASAAFTL